jgi:hypothetical protein
MNEFLKNILSKLFIVTLGFSIVTSNLFSDDILFGDSDMPEEFGNIFDLVSFVDEIKSGNTEDSELSRKFEDDIDGDLDSSRGIADPISLWNRTGGSRTRDPLFLVPNRKLTTDTKGFCCNLFFNRSPEVDIAPEKLLSEQSTNIINEFLNDEELDLEDFGAALKLLPYILNMSTQEHRLGAYLQYSFSKDRWVFELDTILLLSVKNYWLKGKESRADLAEILSELDDLDGGPLYKAKYGVGDSRFKFGYEIIDTDNLKVNFGSSIIMPTSRMCSSGRPKFSINTKAGDDRKELIDDLLNVSRRIIIEPKLGSGAWGLGAFLDFRSLEWKNKLEFWGHLSWDYLFPVKDYRFVASDKKVSMIEVFSAETIPESFPISDFFPHLVKASIFPGSILNSTIGARYRLSKHWRVGAGYDFYLQQKESGHIKDDSIDKELVKTLKLNQALGGRIIQHKVFSEILFEKKHNKFDLLLGFGGDKTISTTRGSRDWTIHGKIGFRF